MIVERLDPSFAAAYRALMLEAYAAHPDAFTSSVGEREALPLAWWEKRLDASPAADEQVFAVLRAGRLVGVAGLAFETREKARHKAKLFGMYVPPAERGQGPGRRLVDRVLAEAAFHAGIRVIQLSVTHGNTAAVALYERCGFRQFGLEPMAVTVASGFVAKIHMWREVGDGASESTSARE